MSTAKRARTSTEGSEDFNGDLRLPAALQSPALPAKSPILRARLPPLFETLSTTKPPPSLLVLKFGGSSLATAEHIRGVANIVRGKVEERPIVVLSAMGKTTNMLLFALQKALESSEVDMKALQATHEQVFEDLGIVMPESVKALLEDLNRLLSGVALLKEVSAKTRDAAVSFGERLSVRVFTAAFNASSGTGVQARPFDSWEIGMLTSKGSGSADSAHSEVEILPRAHHEIGEAFAPLREQYTHIPCVTGYIAKDVDGVITTLGRDGSDLSAAVIGAAVNASEIQIWKDVSGILSADPRLVASAKVVEMLTYEEAAELSTFGAKVVHPAAVLPAWSLGVPIRVKNSFRPDDAGTKIVTSLSPGDTRAGKVVAISSKRDINVVVIRSTRMLGQHGFLLRVFQIFHDFQVSIDVISTSEVTVSLTLDRNYKQLDLEALVHKLSEVATVSIKHHMATLTLLTHKQDSGTVMQEALTVFSELDVFIEMVSHGASNVGVTFVFQDGDLHRSIQGLHKHFF